MLLISLDPYGNDPKYKGIIREILSHIEGGRLNPGDRLPSTRCLAQTLGVHRSTVMLAYQELWSQGYITMRVGVRPTVRQRPLPEVCIRHKEKSLIDWNTQGMSQENLPNPLSTSMEACLTAKSSIDFSRLEMDHRLYPLVRVNTCLSEALRTHPQEMLGYGDAAGDLPLREYLSRYLGRHGIAADTDDILITNGTQHSLDLILRLLASPGETVIVEEPTYGAFLRLLKLHSLTPVAIPMEKEGMDLNALETFLQSCDAKQLPKLIYTMPNFQNPTGITTSQPHRERLLSIVEHFKIPLIEDGFEEEMKYQGMVTLPIKSMDKQGMVLYCGTFSKTLAPGLRTGWIAADRNCIARLTQLIRITEFSPAQLLHGAIWRLCVEGTYDRHLSRMHRVFRKRMRAALSCLKENIPRAYATWEEPTGGYLIWMRLEQPTGKAPLTYLQWETVLTDAGLKFHMGNSCFSGKNSDIFIRISIATLDEDEIKEGIMRLSTALARLHHSIL